MNDEQKRARVEKIFQHELEMFDFDAPIDVLKYTIDEDSFLHIAAFRGNMEAVKLLVELGIDINALGDMSYTALHYAAMEGYPNSQEPYVRWQRNGQPLDTQGKILPTAKTPEAHIPLKNFHFNPEVYE